MIKEVDIVFNYGGNRDHEDGEKYETEASPQQFQTKQSTAYGPKIGNDEDPALRPMGMQEESRPLRIYHIHQRRLLERARKQSQLISYKLK
ncbi:hypothetical protein KY285_011628 [Solanum tuberosum]|nr:hypothetical protein KY285_011628 [Solanum tuberosum]